MLDFMIATPKRHILARNRVFWHILRQNRSRGLGCSELQEPKKTEKRGKKLTRFGAQSHACAETNPWADRDELLHRCRGPRRNHLCQLSWLSLMGFNRGGGGGQNLGFSIDSCECVIGCAFFFFCQYLSLLRIRRFTTQHHFHHPPSCSFQ